MKTRIVGLAATAGCMALAVFASTADAKGCGSAGGYYVTANGNTSCPFARSVARKYYPGRHSMRVYSPVTGRTYTMYCNRRNSYSYECRGGNNAYVRMTE